MARSRTYVHESLEELEELEEQHRGTPLEERVKMLKLLKNDHSTLLGDLGPHLGRSERSLQRWLGTYRKRGLQALLQMGQRGGKRPRRIDDKALQDLRQRLMHEGFSELKEAQQWIQENYGISYSRSGTWHLMRSVVGAIPRGWTTSLNNEPSLLARRGSAPTVPIGLSSEIMAFLNSLPTSSNAVEWISSFKESLRELLGDIDRVSMNVNTNCSLGEPEAPNFFIIQNVDDDHGLTVNTSQTPFERMLESFRQQGFPFNDYHPPYCFDYYYHETGYLGTLFLWREVQKTPIPEKTLETLKMLEPFVIFALSDLVARHQSEKPIDRVFNDALANLVDEAGLTPQEQRIVVLQLMGHAYKEMADILSVSIDTVKKHFKQIHRKTGTRGQAELFAKYFTSRLIPENLRQSAE